MEREKLSTLIKMAFNLGVWMRQKEGDKNIFDIGRELRNIIYQNISQAYADSCPEEVIVANVNYLLQIPLLGYIFSCDCAYDEELKNKIPILIVAKILSEISNDPNIDCEDYEDMVSENDDEIYLNKEGNIYRNGN